MDAMEKIAELEQHATEAEAKVTVEMEAASVANAKSADMEKLVSRTKAELAHAEDERQTLIDNEVRTGTIVDKAKTETAALEQRRAEEK